MEANQGKHANINDGFSSQTRGFGDNMRSGSQTSVDAGDTGNAVSSNTRMKYLSETEGGSSSSRRNIPIGLGQGSLQPKMMSFVSQALNNGASTSSSNMLQLVPSRKGTLHRRSSVVKSLNTHERSGDFQIAISVSNTCGAWDNAKKYVEAGVSDHAKSLDQKGQTHTRRL
ncbi:hypothetical protein R6Q59_027526 [Mikania micrantha]